MSRRREVGRPAPTIALKVPGGAPHAHHVADMSLAPAERGRPKRLTRRASKLRDTFAAKARKHAQRKKAA